MTPNENFYSYMILVILEICGRVASLQTQQMKSDRTIPNNKPDITMRHNEKGTCLVIDNVFSGDRTVIKKEAEKILKYENIRTEIEIMQKNRSDTIIKRGNCNDLKVIHKISDNDI